MFVGPERKLGEIETMQPIMKGGKIFKKHTGIVQLRKEHIEVAR